MENKSAAPTNFIKQIVEEDLRSGKTKTVATRFPPEPNGYLHIGHAKSICLNFELAREFGGKTNLRFDDTNPAKESAEYVRAIQEDVKWLGFEWDGLFFASDYFEEMHNRAVLLIKKGKAYVDDQTAEQIREMRGTLTEAGKDSPCRNRSAEENLDLFARMRSGEFGEGEKVLRAKIDMASGNMNLRDPVIYRVSLAHHHNTGDAWRIYPMYAFAHPLEDAIEGITHSICTLEFEEQRPLYDWVVRECEMESVPRQYEFAKLKLSRTIVGKRFLRNLVEKGFVDGWDDPRMPTIAGLRRRGYTPESIRNFCREIGVSKGGGVIELSYLEHFLREDLKLKAPRTMAVIEPLKVVISNYPEGQTEMMEVENNQENEAMGNRMVPFSREIYIERDDFMEIPVKGYHRLFPGNEVRLKNAYFIKCEEAVKDADGNIVELRCTYDPETRSGSGYAGRKVKGTIHWVEASQALPAEFRLYEPMLSESQAEGADDFIGGHNPDSLRVLRGYVETNMRESQSGDKFQFYRHGYFSADPKASETGALVFNRAVSLKSSFDPKTGK